MWIHLVTLFVVLESVMGAYTRFTNIECEVLDPKYCVYNRCDLKLISRGIVALNVHAKLLNGPFKNGKVFSFDENQNRY